MHLTGQIGHDKTGIDSFSQGFHFSDHPWSSGPTFQRPVGEILEDPLRLLLFEVPFSYLLEFLENAFQQSVISCDTKDIQHIICKYSLNPSGTKLKSRLRTQRISEIFYQWIEQYIFLGHGVMLFYIQLPSSLGDPHMYPIGCFVACTLESIRLHKCLQ